jgi:hypothetical protein
MKKPVVVAVPLRLRYTEWMGCGSCVESWHRFLRCWAEAFAREHKKRSGVAPAAHGHLTVMNGIAPEMLPPDCLEIRRREVEIHTAEHRLGLTLPPSYRAFLQAFPRGHHVAAGEGEHRGFFPPAQIDRLEKLAPVLLARFEEAPVEAGLHEYCTYGVDQNPGWFRTRYLREAIVIGRYADDAGNLILLHPQERSRDGGMEAGLLFSDGEYRAPLLVELMRQLCHREIFALDAMPPYLAQIVDETGVCPLGLCDTWWA